MTDFLSALLEKYQVRRTKKQKDDFIAYARAVSQSAGYSFAEETQKGLLPSRSLIAGDPEKAKAIFTAHYDTCARMPFPNLIYPQGRGLSLLAQMPLILVLVALALGSAYLAARLGGRPAGMAAGYIVYFGLFALVFFGPANPHTANDNTSGVAALMEIMHALPPEEKSLAAFIFFDNEEYGKVGSRAYAKAHPGITEGKALINLDCVGDGDDFLIVAPKAADERLLSLLKAAFRDEGGKRALHCSARNTNYNSDQKSFPNGTAAAAVQKGRLGLCVPRIHTRRDTVCEKSNLDYVRACCARLVHEIATEEKS